MMRDALTIITTTTIEHLNRPARNGEKVAALPAGIKIEVLESKDSWLLVRAPKKQQGWVRASSLPLYCERFNLN